MPQPGRQCTPEKNACNSTLRVVDLGRMPYHDAYQVQRSHHAEVLAARRSGGAEPGRLLLVEHDPVVTITRRPGVADHVLASPELLAQHGVTLEQTDRGGDVTYHGPGQIVCYPIVDLRAVGLRLHEYLRVLEGAIMRTIGHFSIDGVRDPEATGVWVPGAAGNPERKIAAIGVRVERWITLHGLALNVRPELEHFGMIVPCGLAGRPVTSMENELAAACPKTDAVREQLCAELLAQLCPRVGPR